MVLTTTWGLFCNNLWEDPNEGVTALSLKKQGSKVNKCQTVRERRGRDEERRLIFCLTLI